VVSHAYIDTALRLMLRSKLLQKCFGLLSAKFAVQMVLSSLVTCQWFPSHADFYLCSVLLC